MPLPDSQKIIEGTTIVVADSLYVPTVVSIGDGTADFDIDIKDLAAGAARQSQKIDFGVDIDLEWVLSAALEWETTPEIAAGETVEFYIGWSEKATAGTDNPAALTGVDGAYTGMAGGTLDGSLKLIDSIGVMTQDNVINTDTVGVQYDSAIRTFTPRARYGNLVVVNRAALAALHSDAVEMAIGLRPLVFQVQD